MKITSAINAIKIPFLIPIAPGKNLERFVYSYLVSGKERTCLIDSGVSGAEAVILDSLGELGRNTSDLTFMIFTHAHPDHIGGAQAIKKLTNCHVGGHPAAKKWVENVEEQYRERPVPGFHSLVGGSVNINQLLSDNERIDLGGLSLQVIYTPGHSKCSISLLCEQEGVLFTGDAIPQSNDLPIYEDVSIALESIKRLRKVEGIKYLLSSWSDPQINADPYQIMEDGLQYFQKIHTAIQELPNRESITDPMSLCKNMVEKLGLPEVAVNPLVARSFSSHIPLINQEEL